MSLAARMMVGSAVAFGMASSSRGAAFATASAYLLCALRVRLGRRSRAANVLGGMLEDLLAVGSGLALTRG